MHFISTNGIASASHTPIQDLRHPSPFFTATTILLFMLVTLSGCEQQTFLVRAHSQSDDNRETIELNSSSPPPREYLISSLSQLDDLKYISIEATRRGVAPREGYVYLQYYQQPFKDITVSGGGATIGSGAFPLNESPWISRNSGDFLLTSFFWQADTNADADATIVSLPLPNDTSQPESAFRALATRRLLMRINDDVRYNSTMGWSRSERVNIPDAMTLGQLAVPQNTTYYPALNQTILSCLVSAEAQSRGDEWDEITAALYRCYLTPAQWAVQHIGFCGDNCMDMETLSRRVFQTVSRAFSRTIQNIGDLSLYGDGFYRLDYIPCVRTARDSGINGFGFIFSATVTAPFYRAEIKFPILFDIMTETTYAFGHRRRMIAVDITGANSLLEPVDIYNVSHGASNNDWLNIAQNHRTQILEKIRSDSRLRDGLHAMSILLGRQITINRQNDADNKAFPIGYRVCLLPTPLTNGAHHSTIFPETETPNKINMVFLE